MHSLPFELVLCWRHSPTWCPSHWYLTPVAMGSPSCFPCWIRSVTPVKAVKVKTVYV